VGAWMLVNDAADSGFRITERGLFIRSVAAAERSCRYPRIRR